VWWEQQLAKRDIHIRDVDEEEHVVEGVGAGGRKDLEVVDLDEEDDLILEVEVGNDEEKMEGEMEEWVNGLNEGWKRKELTEEYNKLFGVLMRGVGIKKKWVKVKKEKNDDDLMV
jgi:hypothetical protein